MHLNCSTHRHSDCEPDGPADSPADGPADGHPNCHPKRVSDFVPDSFTHTSADAALLRPL